ncbi:uncharacterized protein LOC116251665 isoform X4 [Nymphaea colorata]|nr:uncharacterized protein LOC116251665 isoform X4 [Nymphaea colorata]
MAVSSFLIYGGFSFFILWRLKGKSRLRRRLQKEMSPTKQGNASTSGDEKMVWRHFIGVGGKGPSAISVLTHGRLLLDRHYRLWVCCWAVTVEMTAGCYDYCCAFIASSVRLFKFQPARPQRLGVLSALNIKFLMDGEGGHSSCWAFCNMPDTHDLLPHFCLVCWWSHCIIVPTRSVAIEIPCALIQAVTFWIITYPSVGYYWSAYKILCKFQSGGYGYTG